MNRLLIGLLVVIAIALVVVFTVGRNAGAARSLCDDIPAMPTGLTNDNVTELKTEDLATGTGQEAKAGDTISVQYVGRLMDGKTFDSSCARGADPASFPIGVGQVIPGWDQGIPGMKVGGQRRLIIPARLAYGEQGAPPVIPPNSALVFDVELVDVTKGP